MSPDDLVTIFTKLPDPDVITALMSLDEKKAGKVLAGLPPTRAAHLTQEMSHPRPISRAVASL
jgi:flagellar motility protein MotE (MotC chaperone)